VERIKKTWRDLSRRMNHRSENVLMKNFQIYAEPFMRLLVNALPAGTVGARMPTWPMGLPSFAPGQWLLVLSSPFCR
jgi:hypothetical protein